MAVRATPSFVQAGSHPAEETRLMVASLVGASTGSFSGGVASADSAHGVVLTSDLAVTANGTPNMSVNIAAGGAFIRNTESANGGAYHLWNDATLNLAIAAADATNARRDLVIAQVRDAAYSGASNDARIIVVTGTPAASPSDPSLSSYPNALVLARVAVAAGATSITSGNITDLRTLANVRSELPVVASTTARDQFIPSPGDGQAAYVNLNTTDEGLYFYNGTSWRRPWNMPWGVMGHFANTSNYSRTAETLAEISSAFRLTVSTAANRRLKFTFSASYKNIGAGGVVEVYNNTTSAAVGRVFEWSTSIGSSHRETGSFIATSSSSSTVYTLTFQALTAGSGAGTFEVRGSDAATQFTIEDIGPSGAPA